MRQVLSRLLLTSLLMSVPAMADIYMFKGSDGEWKTTTERVEGIGQKLVSKEGWVRVGSMDENDSIFVQKKSIAKKGRYVKAWFFWNYSEKKNLKADPTKEYTHFMSLDYFDCLERSAAVAQHLHYNGKDVVHSQSFEIEKLKYIDVAPNTIGESMLEVVCNAQTPSEKRNDKTPQLKPETPARK